MEVVVNKCYGGFGLSHEAVMLYAKYKGITLYPWIDDISKEVYKDKATLDNPEMMIHYTTVPEAEYEAIVKEEKGKPVGVGRFKKSSSAYFSDRDIERTDPILIRVVRELGKRANSRLSELKVVKIPDDIEYQIEEYDGVEWIAEEHRTWS